MSAYARETVLAIRHWTDSYFSFTTSRNDALRFENGQFVMVGMMIEGKPLTRAYSIASANWEEQLEFFSIKVPNGPLTSRLQYIQPGDELLVSRKPTGSLLISDLLPGRNLYLLATGTGLAPFLPIIKDPHTYERFEHIVLTHGVRTVPDLAYQHYITDELPHHEYLGEQIRRQLHYYPVVSREPFLAPKAPPMALPACANTGRVTERLERGELAQDLGLPALDPEHDRAMICGSTHMLADCRRILDARGFHPAPRIGTPGQYVFERAFVDK